MVANLVGALLDLLIQMFALFFLAAGIVPLLRGSADGVWFLLGGVVLLAVLIRRVLRRECPGSCGGTYSAVMCWA